ncbi:MAG: fluoride efflux transporter CrcB [Rhodothermaceae bacterium]|nr:fluoride efflux transporter CrcB [Rhodothermaceae bacterium]
MNALLPLPVLIVAVGGAVGAVARYGVGLLALRVSATGLPLGTWAVNLVGSFLIGLTLPFLMARGSDEWRLALVVGFLGAFTTFSTFSLDTLVLWENGRPGWAVLNAAGSVVLGLACVALGFWIARH